MVEGVGNPDNICAAILASPLRRQEYVEKLKRTLIDNVAAKSGVTYLGVIDDVPPRNVLNGCEALFGIVATGGTEHIMLSIASIMSGKPIIYASVPYANSLPAIVEARPLLQDHSVAIVHLPRLEENPKRMLEMSLAALRAVTRLHNARLGVLGGPSPWLVYSRVSPSLLYSRLGIEIVNIDLSLLYEKYMNAKPPVDLVEKILNEAHETLVDRRRVEDALRVYIALKEIIEEYKLDIISVKCFDIIKTLKTTACLAFSLLNDGRFIAGCEGDIPAAISMAILTYVSQKPSFIGNLAIVEEKTMLISHCTAPMGLASNGYRLDTHYESGEGVGVALYFREGEPVTVMRLSPDLSRMRVLRGKLVKGKPELKEHCRSQAWVELNSDPKVLVDRSLGNHYAMTYGDYVDALRIVAELLGMEFEFIE